MKAWLGLVGFVGMVATGCNSGGVSAGATEGTPTPEASPTETPSVTPTPPPTGSTIRFVALGDTGTGYDNQYPVASAIAQKCAEDGCDFGVLLGDNFYNSGVTSPTDPQFVDKFEQPYGGLPFPFYVTLGNHDYGGDGAGYEFDRGAHQVAYAQTHPQFVLPAEYYSFKEEPATFLALGTNLVFWDHDDAMDVQGEYVSTVLDGSQEPWRIVVGHHPYLSNGKHGNAGSYDGVPDWVPIAHGKNVKDFFETSLCGRIDLYISGHDHSRQILPGNASCDATFVVTGAGAKTTELLGSNPSVWQADTLGFTYFVVTDESITIEMIDAAGNLEYTHTITHP